MAKKKTAKKNEVAVVAEVVESAMQTVTPMDLIVQAQGKGASIEQMQQLFELNLRYEENEAKKAYHVAVAAFKSEGIVIIKDKSVSFNQTSYNHASIGNAVAQIIPSLSRHGLSHSWDINQDGGQITVTCRLAHELGHFTEVSMSAGKDDSGKKNQIQQVASTITYLQRYTLFAITGLAAMDQDDDGGGSEEDDVEYISESQVCDLEALVEQAKVPMKGFLVWLKVADLAEIPVERFSAAVDKLNTKIGGA